MAEMTTFRQAVGAWAAGGPGDEARAWAERLPVRAVVLLEGPSDVAAVDALAARRGRDLAGEGVCVLPIGGAMSVGRYAEMLGPSGLGLRLTGLCDARERGFYARGWERAGAPPHGYHVCTADLEDELIRALGVDRVRDLVRAEGDLRALETFRRQPAQRERAADSNCGASSAPRRGARSATAGCSSRRWDPSRPRRPSRSCWPACERTPAGRRARVRMLDACSHQPHGSTVASPMTS